MIKAAARLGYQPVRRGGAPLPSSPTSIGFICDEISTDPWTSIGFDARAGKGLGARAHRHGDGDARRRRDGSGGARATQRSRRCSASIYATINTRLVDRPATPPQTPVVLLNCHAANEPLPSVVPGEVAGGHAATDLLLRAGHRRIGYINGEPSMEASRHRLRGYRRALATADLPFDPNWCANGNWQPISGYEGAHAN